jgi:ribosomal protein L37E
VMKLLRRLGLERCRECGFTRSEWDRGVPSRRKGQVHAGPCSWDDEPDKIGCGDRSFHTLGGGCPSCDGIEEEE